MNTVDSRIDWEALLSQVIASGVELETYLKDDLLEDAMEYLGSTLDKYGLPLREQKRYTLNLTDKFLAVDSPYYSIYFLKLQNCKAWLERMLTYCTTARLLDAETLIRYYTASYIHQQKAEALLADEKQLRMK